MHNAESIVYRVRSVAAFDDFAVFGAAKRYINAILLFQQLAEQAPLLLFMHHLPC